MIKCGHTNIQLRTYTNSSLFRLSGSRGNYNFRIHSRSREYKYTQGVTLNIVYLMYYNNKCNSSSTGAL